MQLTPRFVAKGRPLFRWAGGKRRFVEEIVSLFPLRFDRYFEPFVGGGALFFSLQPGQSVLSDTNEELINTYRQVKDQPDTVVKALRKMPNTKDDYYRIRESEPQDKVKRAARFIYLMNLSFNGLYRVNSSGSFNVPYGHNNDKPAFYEERIYATSGALSAALIEEADFGTAMEWAEPNDLVYVDPPYTVLHDNNGFLAYNAKIFSWDDQQRLAAKCIELAERGCAVFISNAHHKSILDLYKDFERHDVKRFSTISGVAKYRQSVAEYVFYRIPKRMQGA